MNLKIYIFCLFITAICGKESLEEKNRRLPNAIAVVGRSFEYHLPPRDGSRQQYKVLEKGKTILPKWLSLDTASNQLHGLPLWRNKGKVDIEVHSKQGHDKAEFSITVQDLHSVLENKSMISNETKVPSYAEPKCPNGIPAAVATIQFDLHIDKLCGEDRINLMRKMSDFADVDMAELHMAVGKGHNTAFGLKDVMTVTAGPGNVADSKQPGVVVSWKIGCGIDLSGMHMATLLKSSSQHGTFKRALDAPVSGWHIATGQPKAHQKRLRRQAANLLPTPTLTRTFTSFGTTPTSTLAPPSVTVTHTFTVTPTTITTDTVAPRILNSINSITVYLGMAIRFKIPEDTFYDDWELAFTRNLRLDMRNFADLSPLPSSSWILFDSDKQEIYGLPFGNNLAGSHRFVIRAADKAGNIATDPLTVQVSNRQFPYNHKFTICLNYNYEAFMSNVNVRLLLIKKITAYYGYDMTKLQVVSYTYQHGTLFFTFQFELTNENCNSLELTNLLDGFGSNSQMNPSFKKSLRPEFNVMYGFHEGIGPCKPTPAPNTKPVVNHALGQLSVYLGQGMRYVIPWNTFYDEQDFYTRSLTLELKTKTGGALSMSSWIGFNSSQQEIYAQPNYNEGSLVGLREFRLVAIDKEELSSFTNVKVLVVGDTNRYNHEFKIVLRKEYHDYKDLAEHAENRMSLLEAIAKYYTLNLGLVRVVKYLPGVSFHFSFDSIPYGDCNNPLLKRLIDGFWIHGDKNEINPKFVAALHVDNFRVKTGHYHGIGPCRNITPPRGSPPKGLRRINKVVKQGQAIYFHIPWDTFFDEQDFYTPNLRLSLRTKANSDLPPSSWIYLDSSKQDIYGLPININTVGRTDYKLVATDRDGMEGDTRLRVTVEEDSHSYIHRFSIRIENYASVKGDVVMLFQLLEKIANYYGLNYQNITVFSQESDDSFSFGFDTIPSDNCESADLQKLIDGFWTNTNLNPKFKEALSPDFRVISGYHECQVPCSCNTRPRLISPINRQTVYEGQAMVFSIPALTFYDREDGYTPNLNLDFTTEKSGKLPPTSWILLYSSPQQIKMLPIEKDKIGMHNFHLIATDREGLEALDAIEVEVLDDTNTYNHMFSIEIGDTILGNDVNTRVRFVDKLAKYFGVSFSAVRVRSYGPGVETTFQFFNDLECDNPVLLKWKASFIKNGKLNEKFVNALSPEFQVTSGLFKRLDICKPPDPNGTNAPPVLYNHIDRLNIFQGQGLRFVIPNDTFYDKEDLYTYNLRLQMQTIDGDSLLRTSWVLLNSSRQEIYGLPFDVDTIGLHEFLMVAADRKGRKAYDAFEVRVLENTVLYNHNFHILIDYNNVSFMDNVGVRVFLLEKIASYFGVNFTNVRVAGYAPGVLFTFYFDFIPYEECSNPLLVKLIDGFWFSGKLNPQFVSALAPDFKVISGSYEELPPCKLIEEPDVGAFGDRPGGIWWTYAIIPAIVLAVVLLLIGCCVLILMGCCRKQKLGGTDKTTFIYKRKPVVLQEEYEIKELLLKQPTVLPNEKPPVPPVYPRSPVLSGDKTPLLMETKSVPYQAPTFLSSRQVSSGGGGGSGNAGFVANGGRGSGAAGGGFSAAGGAAGGGGAFGSAAVGGGSAAAAGGAGGGSAGGGGGAAGGGGGAGGALGGGGAAGGGGAGGVTFSMASGGGGGSSFRQASYSYSYSSSGGSVLGGSRKAGYAGYRLPPAYVPP